jgi:methyl coenzyme M reductase beta subunit
MAGGSALFGIRTRALAAAAGTTAAAIQTAIATVVTIFAADVFDVDVFDNDFFRTPITIRINDTTSNATARGACEQAVRHFADSLFFRSSIEETNLSWTLA